MIRAARWTSQARQAVIVTLEDYSTRVITADDPLWNKLGPPLMMEEPISPDLVRAEAARRMRELLGARDEKHLDIIITNGLREAARLLQKEVAGERLTEEERARQKQLKQIDAAIEAIRAASNRLEAMEPIPDDYADDKYWPAAPRRS